MAQVKIYQLNSLINLNEAQARGVIGGYKYFRFSYDFNGDRSFNKQFALNDSMVLQLALDTKLYGYNAGNSISIHQVAYNHIG